MNKTSWSIAYFIPLSLTIKADVADSDGAVSKVEFYLDGVMQGVVTETPFLLAFNDLGIGEYSVQVRAFDDTGGVTSSPTSLVTVLSPTATAMVSFIHGEPDGSVQLRIVGLPGQSLQIEKSIDLENWETLTTLTNTIGTIETTDAAATGNIAFYRARLR